VLKSKWRRQQQAGKISSHDVSTPLVTAVEVPRCLLPLQNHNPDAKIHVFEMATSGDKGGEDCGPWKKQSAEHCFELLVNCTFWVLSAAAAAAGAADAASAAQT